jgi:hypothetical protein
MSLYPIAFFDPPIVLESNVTNIPGSGSLPLQVIANIGNIAAYSVAFIDSTGEYIGVYTGVSGSETLVCIIGGGQVGVTPGVFSARSRVSLRSMTTSAITNGNLTCTFLGAGWKGGAS